MMNYKGFYISVDEMGGYTSVDVDGNEYTVNGGDKIFYMAYTDTIKVFATEPQVAIDMVKMSIDEELNETH